MNTLPIYNQVLSFVAKDKLDEAIKILLSHFDNHQVILQSAKLESIKNEIISGTISFEDASIEKNKIRKAIIALAETTKEKYNLESKKKTNKKVKQFLNYFIRKRNSSLLAFFSFLLLTSGDLIKQFLILIASGILIFAGASFYISFRSHNQTVNLKKENFHLQNELDNNQAKNFAICEIALEEIKYHFLELRNVYILELEDRRNSPGVGRLENFNLLFQNRIDSTLVFIERIKTENKK